jgi:hypothetical protein
MQAIVTDEKLFGFPYTGNSTSLVEDLSRTVLAMVVDYIPIHAQNRAVCGSDRLRDLGVTSLRLIGLIMALENRFGLSDVALATFTNETTVDAVVGLCRAEGSIEPTLVDVEQKTH